MEQAEHNKTKKQDKNMDQTQAITLIRAHQFCYYVRGTPVISDHEYDDLCRLHGIDGSGGSDLADSYSLEEQILASDLMGELFVPTPEP